MTIREKPIIFSGEMVRAILEGRKTQTRRVVKPQSCKIRVQCGDWLTDSGKILKCPYGMIGQRLWVRETWCCDEDDQPVVFYKSTDHPSCGTPWCPSIHMPRWASRLTLEIVSVRIERIQSITEADAVDEGSYLDRCPCLPRSKDRTPMAAAFKLQECRKHGSEFTFLWDYINAKRGYGWDKNPWVWVLQFRKL